MGDFSLPLLVHFSLPVTHEWAFWDTYIKKFIDWLPLGEAVQGIGSGHVME
ncbi:MAG: hypothetical protein ACLUIO_03315 [Neglectibacter timonensis]